jgi:hypothetical protein
MVGRIDERDLAWAVPLKNRCEWAGAGGREEDVGHHPPRAVFKFGPCEYPLIHPWGERAAPQLTRMVNADVAGRPGTAVL